IKNTGSVDGKEIVQLYVSDKTNAACRPPKELKGFEKVFVPAGKTAEVKFTLDERSLAWYNTEMHDWYAASGKYEILIGSSSRDIKLVETVDFTTGKKMPLVITEDTTAGDILRDERVAKILRDFADSHSDGDEGESSKEAITQEMKDEMFDGLPLRNLLMMGSDATQEEYEELLARLKKAVE
ncbi:MAG: fibronectin type III-like domain-contianing protein, partial [Treponema sp.]|nr:fibronectin type III-like domain-contianing protein [Treponema sp.]